jgi:MFS family permease
MPRSRTRVALAGVVFAVLLAQVLLYPGIDLLVRDLGAETALSASTWFLAAEFAAFVVLAGLWGAVSDVTGRRIPFIAAGAAGGALGYLALAVVPGPVDVPWPAILLARFCQGAATIGAFSLSMTTLMDLEGGHGRNMGAAGIAIGLGTAVGAPLGGQLYGLGPRVPLFAAAALLFAVAVLVCFAAETAPDGTADSLGRVVGGLRSTPTLSIPYAFGFVDRMTAGFFALVGTLYFRTVFDLSPGATGLVLLLFFAPFALLQYPLGILSDRIGRTLPVFGGSVLYGVGVIAVGQAPTVVLAGAAMVVVGVLGALMAPATMALVSDLAVSTERGVAMAGFNVFGSVGFLAGVVVGGTVAGAIGFPGAFLVVGGFEVAIALVLLPAVHRIELGPRSVGEAP